ncbi:MAG: DUF2092 domain-containing protein [Burkholderiales bacterium]
MHIMIVRALAALAFIALPTMQPALGAQTPAMPAPVMDPRALALLNAMKTKLAAAKAFSFRARSTTNAPDATGQALTLVSDTVVKVMRPDKLNAKVRGDAPPLDFFFDGATMTAYQPTLNLYATAKAPKTIEALIPFALEKAGIPIPFADLIFSDPYATLTGTMTRASFAGASTIRGIRCEHAAFAGPGIKWEIWIDTRTSLPCQFTGALVEAQGSPRLAMEFHDWKLNPPLAASSFAFAKPAGALQVDFPALTGQ